MNLRSRGLADGALPEVRRVVLSGGVTLAYREMGDGPPLVLLFPYHVNHLELTWATPLHREAIVRLAESFRVVNVDLRGTGLSDRNVDDISLEVLAEDVGALMDHLGVASAAICTMGNAALIAFRLAAARTERVTRLALIAAGSSLVDGRLFELHELNPELHFEARASLVAGLGDSLTAAALASTMKNAVSAETFSRFLEAVKSTDVAALAAQVPVPVLLLNATNDRLIPIASAHRLAHILPDATVLPVDGDSAIAPWRDPAAVNTMIEFLGGSAQTTGTRRRGVAAAADLTTREIQVLRLIAQGRTNKQIADQLYISPNTVSHHLRGIFGKTASHNRSEAASFAHRNGLA